jgi:putative DNA primase/helicase
MVENSFHPDPHAEAIRWAICESELIQAIGRARAVRRTANDPLQVDILTNIALPDVIVNETVTWERMEPTFAQIMASRGAVPLNYADMAIAYDDLFKSGDAARMALSRENSEQTPIREYLIGVCSEFSSISYRHPGSTRGPGARLLFDPARFDPAAWLRERIDPEIAIIERRAK